MLSPLQSVFLRFTGQQPDPFDFGEGFQCFLGRDPDCGLGWGPSLLFGVYCVASIFNDASYLCLTKYGSAAFMTVVDGFAVPLIELFMALPLMGRFREPFNKMNILGTAFCTMGMVFWAKGESEEEARTKRVRLDRQGSHMEMQVSSSDVLKGLRITGNSASGLFRRESFRDGFVKLESTTPDFSP
jgi:hypothetical protein